MKFMKPRREVSDEDEDPLSGVANLFDVAMMVLMRVRSIGVVISVLLKNLIFLGQGLCIPSLRVWLEFMEMRMKKHEWQN